MFFKYIYKLGPKAHFSLTVIIKSSIEAVYETVLAFCKVYRTIRNLKSSGRTDLNHFSVKNK